VLFDHRIDVRIGGELLVGSVGDVVTLRPIADRGEFDVDHRGDEIASVADRHRLANVGEELELVLDVFGREHLSALETADILRPIDDLKLAVGPEKAGVASLDVAVVGHGFARLVRLAEVADEHAGRPELHLAVGRDAKIDVRRRRTDGVGAHGPVGLGGHKQKGFRLPIELFQVEADRAIEGKEIGADRFASRVGHADPG
jgi:hypothetical protein